MDARALYLAAIQDCTHAIQLDPEKRFLLFGNRGVAKAALGDAEGAIEDFDVAIRFDSEEAEYLYERGACERSIGAKGRSQSRF